MLIDPLSAAIDRGGACLAPTRLVPAVDDDFNCVLEEFPVERPEEVALLVGQDHQHRRASRAKQTLTRRTPKAYPAQSCSERPSRQPSDTPMHSAELEAGEHRWRRTLERRRTSSQSLAVDVGAASRVAPVTSQLLPPRRVRPRSRGSRARATRPA